MRKTKILLLLLLGTVAQSACSFKVGDLNNPGVDEFGLNPTPESIYSAAIGMIISNQKDYGSNVGFVLETAIVAREAYNFDPADPRFVSELLLAEALSAGEDAFGGAFWSRPFANIAAGDRILAALERVVGMSEEQKAGVRGFVYTFQALEYLEIISTRDDNGAPIAVSRIGGELAPIVDKATVFAHISTLLDDGSSNLAAAGEAFGMTVPFANFDTPATFLTFNRALAARVHLYRGNFAQSLAALDGSFITADPMNPQLALGVYHSFGTGNGETANGLISPTIFANPRIRAGLEMGDLREAKITAVDPTEFMGINASDQFTLYGSPTAQMPIIRNEELILIRAEAHLGLGTAGDLVAAVSDINFIRNQSAGLGNTTATTAMEIKDALIHERTYSLLFEGHTYFDARRLGYLASLPNPEMGFIHDEWPIPLAEVLARQ